MCRYSYANRITLRKPTFRRYIFENAHKRNIQIKYACNKAILHVVTTKIALIQFLDCRKLMAFDSTIIVNYGCKATITHA